MSVSIGNITLKEAEWHPRDRPVMKGIWMENEIGEGMSVTDDALKDLEKVLLNWFEENF